MRSPRPRATWRIGWRSRRSSAWPPDSIEHIETRSLRWPGYESAIECHLFRFAVGPVPHRISGFAIVGPVTWALIADFSDWPADDIFAAFAGWHAEHEETRKLEPDDLSEDEQALAASLLKRRVVGRLFGISYSPAWDTFSARCMSWRRRGGEEMPVWSSSTIERPNWYPSGATSQPLGPTEAYYIHKGRSILRTFNP